MKLIVYFEVRNASIYGSRKQAGRAKLEGDSDMTTVHVVLVWAVIMAAVTLVACLLVTLEKVLLVVITH